LTIEARAGDRLFTVLRDAGVSFDAPCGGKGTCRKCRVEVVGEGEKLACYYTVDRDVTVNLSTADCGVFARNDGTLAALDIGTTTIALEVYDGKGSVIHSAHFLNPQRVYGADVISRINACKEGHLEKMRDILVNALSLHLGGVKRVITAANATMLHILAGVDPAPIGVAPYKAVFTDTIQVDGKFVLLPSAGAFVGADVTAGILSSGMYEDKGINLFVDLGTNGEIVLKADGRYYGASAAAGPVFEGGDWGKGSDLIDLVAGLLDSGDIDEGGSLKSDATVLTGKDVRAVQLAKAAINATIIMLVRVAGLKIEDIDKVYLAGGLGKGLNPKSAERIGLLPKTLGSKTTALGNAALKGAAMCAKDEKLIEVATQIARSIGIVELTQNAGFFEEYTEAMCF